jgi:phage virion morphogenesis protein
VKGLTLDIGVYKLFLRRRRVTADIEKAYENAIAFLRDVAAGKAGLDQPVGATPQSGSGNVVATDVEEKFSDDNLGVYFVNGRRDHNPGERPGLPREAQHLRPADLAAAYVAIVGAYMLGSIDRTFREGGSPAASWKPWAPSTVKRFGKKAAGRKILIGSGRLKNSVTYRSKGNTVRIGSNLVYAAIHQMGGKAGRNRAATIPARPYLVFRPEDPANIVEACRRSSTSRRRTWD